ncbi:MAG TPA: protein kinase [Kofleriaceae bacterium]|nr:protein kinase [Kofleriaceae bacterium]
MVREADVAVPPTVLDTGGGDRSDRPDRAAERELAGRTLAGRYELLALIGAGGMGAVYRAYDRELDELVAFKVIKAELARQPAMVDRFRHEVKLARRVTHGNVARTFELGHADGVMYCTMELVEGESLHARLERERKLALTDAAAIAAALCEGLAAAHAVGVIHRDIKPDNVLLAPGGRVVLADFGVAAAAADAHTGQLTGTPAYMAPEQARGEPPAPATDVYAVGVLLFEMATGLRAFPGELVDILVAKQDVARLEVPPGSVPPALAHVIGRATAREPADRVATAAELGRMLAPWAGTGGCSATDACSATGSRRATEIRELRTVVVVPPTGDDARLHLAAGVHEELLRRLVRRPHLRVLPSAGGAHVPSAALVELRAGELLSVAIRCERAQTTLHLPLDIASIEPTADAIVGAIVDAVGRVAAGPASPRARAHELLLRARLIVQREYGGARQAVALLEEAQALAPDDPRIAATLAMLRLRFFVVGPTSGDDLAHAGAQVRAALAAAPELPESHVAAGHLELHTGDPAVAAAHFRRAIARSPYLAEAHEGLGRMLLEAGFLDEAMARLEDARAIAPDLSAISLDLARARALEQDWAGCDALIASLGGQHDRAAARLRIAWWRGDLQAVTEVYHQLGSLRTVESWMLDLLYEIAIERTWPARREEVLGHVLGSTSPSLRRRAFIAQIGAEAAGAAGDAPACNAMIAYAVANGLFDLHWLERCPLIEPARRTAEGAAAHARVQLRAEAILDALYGGGAALEGTIAV